MTLIVWFRNDLRVHDLPMLAAGVADANRIVPVFILDDDLLHGEGTSANRNRFLLESLEDLRLSLRRRGGELFIRHGKPSEALVKLAKETGAAKVYCTADYTPFARERDAAVDTELAKNNLTLVTFSGRLALDHPEKVTSNGQPWKVFTPFWKRWQVAERRLPVKAPRRITVPENIEAGELPELAKIAKDQDLSVYAPKGGERAGRQRLQHFLRYGLQDYHKDHNDLGADATSRLSPYLRFGCLSAREIEAVLPPGDGSAAFHRQLAWRDFYHYILWHFPHNLKHELQERFRGMAWNNDNELLKAWKEGRTGYPIVDAAMRQLKREGWMHNRARLIVGSFLTKDLGLDWRHGEAHFLRWLCDGDSATNNGNWQWIASVGADPAPVFRRLYNPTAQAKTYDPDGVYIRRYVPELAEVSDKYLAEPWRMSEYEQQKAGCIIGQDYPSPIVDHATARKAALARYDRN